MSDPLIGAMITAAVAVIGWCVTYFYAKRLEDRRRRLEIRLHHRSQQIEELYGPLLSLIEQIFKGWEVREEILEHCECSAEEKAAIKELIWRRYFSPLHTKIAGLLRTKLYLLEGITLPESFSSYLAHARHEDFRHLLRNELQVDTSGIPERPWPATFHPDVKATLKKLMEERDRGLAQLK